jgi:uncharacterized membrane protein YeiB
VIALSAQPELLDSLFFSKRFYFLFYLVFGVIDSCHAYRILCKNRFKKQFFLEKIPILITFGSTLTKDFG